VCKVNGGDRPFSSCANVDGDIDETRSSTLAFGFEGTVCGEISDGPAGTKRRWSYSSLFHGVEDERAEC